jgi:hypothetical protein
MPFQAQQQRRKGPVFVAFGKLGLSLVNGERRVDLRQRKKAKKRAKDRGPRLAFVRLRSDFEHCRQLRPFKENLSEQKKAQSR